MEKEKSMITNYKLGKIFGPSMVFAGYILMIFGVLTIYFSLTSIGLVILGAFLAFTSSGTIVKADENGYKSYLKLFGVIQVGKKRSFTKGDRIEANKFRGSHVTFSRSNRQSAVEVNDYRIHLIAADTKNKILLARFASEDEAMEELKNLKTLIPNS
jgi:hypothetical protein